ncbi:CopG family transcriptional regulator [Phyllobacterium endophyticum]|uniref:CopG family transcriptional regulator n=2 Tax=Phyllobacterium endophyticum TaxID=1149773 RepID=A0A2P7ARS8_9HYPH|nr:CopG family transcriptional regulator [Phyllobacterium endophyticum]TYR39542.1 CopG family transcriptional regulator [Phyllobacterium endophyticum]
MRDAGANAMRTTLAIDDDVLAAAKGLAELENKTIGEVISMLARKSLQTAVANTSERNGVPLLVVKDGTPVTMEFVNQLRDETS